MKHNTVIDVDFYKTTQRKMYDPAVEGIFSYAESRGGIYNIMVMFGAQGWIKDTLLKPITKADVDIADFIISGMGGFPFDREPWDIVVNEYNGFIPVTIKAIKEGQKVPVKNAVITIECIDRRIFSLVNYLETSFLRAVWFPSTIATRAFHIRKNLDDLFSKYADSSASTDFSFLDFSGRGVESYDASAIGTAAFLTSFQGTDTVAGVYYAYENYGNEICGNSVAATEHSVMTSYGKENEKLSFKRLVSIHKDQVLSVVSDTWNIYQACEYWVSIADDVENQNIQLVVRPDSGDPFEVLPKMLEILSKGYKTHLNDKGLKVFDRLKILWGDGVDETNYLQIFKLFIDLGYGPENLIVGSGGGLMQRVNRDDMKWAFKASAVYKHGQWVPIKKDPITDPGKQSKAGKLELIFHKKKKFYDTVDWTIAHQLGELQLEVVYKNGKLMREQTMKEIRELIRS